jgi:hypothetical protein
LGPNAELDNFGAQYGIEPQAWQLKSLYSLSYTAHLLVSAPFMVLINEINLKMSAVKRDDDYFVRK